MKLDSVQTDLKPAGLILSDTSLSLPVELSYSSQREQDSTKDPLVVTCTDRAQIPSLGIVAPQGRRPEFRSNRNQRESPTSRLS